MAAEKQSYYCAPQWQSYIHIAREELLNNISTEVSSEASIQLAEHKTHESKQHISTNTIIA